MAVDPDAARENGYHPDQEHDRRVDETEAQTGLQIGMDQQRSSSVDPAEFLTEEFTQVITEADVDRNLPEDHPKQHNVETKLGGHLSKRHALGNTTRPEAERQKTLDKARRHLVQMGFRRQGGTGAECTGRTRARMTGGESAAKPMLTADLDEQLDTGMEVKGSLRDASIGGWLLSKIADIQVVSRSEGFKRDNSDDGGVLSRVTGGLLGG